MVCFLQQKESFIGERKEHSMKLLRWIRNLFAALLVVGICAVAVLVWQGYSMYSKAVSETPVS